MSALILEIVTLAALAAVLVIAYRRAGIAVRRAVRARFDGRASGLHPTVESAIVALWPVPLTVLVVPPTIRYVADELRLMGIVAVDGAVSAFGAAARARQSFALRRERRLRGHEAREDLKFRLAALRTKEKAADREVTARREELPCTRCACSKSVPRRIDAFRRRVAHARAEGRAAAVHAVANRVEAAIMTYHGRLAIMERVH